MKKFVSGFIAGALLFAGASAFADSTSLIGQKVQGLFSVEKGGAKIADAVIINGSAYAPVRAVSQAAGVGLTVEGKAIIMSEPTQSISSPVATPTASATPVTSRPTLSPEKEKENKIISLMGKQATLAASITMTEAKLKDDPTNTTLQQKLTELKAEYATLQAQLADLQGQ